MSQGGGRNLRQSERRARWAERRQEVFHDGFQLKSIKWAGEMLSVCTMKSLVCLFAVEEEQLPMSVRSKSSCQLRHEVKQWLATASAAAATHGDRTCYPATGDHYLA